ncbi:pyridoxamine 5'-phosphate oxidase family protein [Bdellovibrio sp. HCB2-146]|uniref:pyridoxamine 5'-phosphate oxidase family protein n=1 Tax=Bdellovibrio sp. HCB2-146 TaxID=3394362 RepID=UPI0039BCDDE8
MEEKEPYIEFTPEMEKLDHLIKDIPFAVMTVHTADGKMRSFPLLSQDLEFDGNLWFLISKKSAHLPDLKRLGDINLSYAGNDKCISINGTVELLEDRDMIREVWQKSHEAWFTQGPADPMIQLIKVHVETAEYWEDHTSPIYKMIDFVKNAVGRPTHKESHGSIDLKH